MSDYVATVRWQRRGQNFTDNRYSRAHVWEFDGGISVPASPSPQVVPAPMSTAEAVDPEEAFVAALSSCHMLFLLAIAAKRGYVIDDYRDRAVGVLAKNSDGRMAMTRVTLRPQIVFSGDTPPDRDQLEALHHRAHRQCFIANSVLTEVVVEIPD